MSDSVKRAEMDAVVAVIASLISWMAQSANSPISVDEARELIQRLDAAGQR